MVDNLQLPFVPTWKSRDTKTRPNIKNPARLNLHIVPQFKNQLPAPTVNGGGDSF